MPSATHGSAIRNQETPVAAKGTDRPSVVYLGMSGALSSLPLSALLEAGFPVRAVVTPTFAGVSPPAPTAPSPAVPRREVPLLAPVAPTIRRLAADHAIPLVEVADLHASATYDALASYAPDAICVSCFPWRLPPAILRLPRLGCLNVHPSLLPDNRGPDPLFWTFRRGDATTDVTIHLMDEGFDTGPVLEQGSISVPDGISEALLERTCAEIGARLLVEALAALATGAAQPQSQDESRATRYPPPTPDDYHITPDRPARWAYNFACGLIGRGQPILIMAPSAAFRLRAPVGYAEDEALDRPWRLDGEILALRCAPGVFRARVVRIR
jgi:methionyl-tRNA formyltransferase